MKLKGGFINIKENLENVKANIKNKFIDILLSGQTDDVKQKILNAIENDERYKEINLKIDFFINKIETFMLNFIQTLTTTGLNLTSIFPIISIVGAIVSTNTCMIPEIIEHGKNGLLSNDPNELRSFLEMLLNNEELAKQLGAAARETMVERFSLDRFVQSWNKLLYDTVENYTYKNGDA